MLVRLVAAGDVPWERLAEALRGAGVEVGEPGAEDAAELVVLDSATVEDVAARVAAGVPVVAGIADWPNGYGPALEAGAIDIYPAGDLAALQARVAVLMRRGGPVHVRRLERLVAVVAASEDAITVYDATGTIVDWNPAAERIYGLAAGEAIGRKAWDLAPEGEREERKALVEGVLSGQALQGVIVRRDGSRGMAGDLSLSAFPLRDAQGRVTGAAAIARDVTAQVEAEREVARLAAIVESAEHAIVGRDNEGRITSWNAGAEQLFGYTAAEMIGGFGWETVPPWREEEYRERLAEVTGDRRVVAEVERMDRSGRVFPVRATTFPVFDRRGRRIGSASFLRDISEERAMVAALERREQVLAALLESSGEAIFLVDRERRITWLNRAAADITEQVTGKRAQAGDPIDDFLREEERAAWESAFGAALAGETERRVGRQRRLDGTEFWYEMTFRPVRLGGGSIPWVAMVGNNVTARVASERALRRSEATLRSIFESTRDHLWLLDPDGRLVTCNGAAAEFARERFGRVPAPGDWMLEFADPESRGLLAATIAEAAGGHALEGELAVPNRDGTRTYFNIHVTPVRGARGATTGVLVAARDVTDEARARRELRRARESLAAEFAKLQTIIENSDEGVILLDRECRVVAFNTEFAEGTLQRRGVRPVPGMHFRETVSPESAEMLLERVREALGGKRVSFEVRSKSPGRQRWFEVRIRPVITPNGEVTGVVYTGRDVTERREQEQRLGEALADLSATFGAIHEGVALIGADGTVLAVNPAAQHLVEDLFGVRPGPGMTWREAVPQESHAAFEEVVTNTLAGETSNFEQMVTDRNGRERWLELSFGRVLMADGSVRGVALGIREVTERKRTEERLLQAQKAESLAVLAGGIAHDFNNLLVGILGNAGLALAELPQGSPARETIREIEVAGQRAAELARQMLAYAGRGKVSTGDVDLDGLVEEMTQLLRTSVGPGVRLVLDLAGGLPPVLGDATQLRQVVMNLVINASDAIGGGEGVVRVSTLCVAGSRELFARAVVVPEEIAERYVVLEVADTGSGMDEATLSRIFDPFFTTKFAGRGLGLAAVLGIVRGHRGGIAVESQPGAGTRFRVMLPVHEGGSASGQERAAATSWRGSGLVIVADDEQSVRAVTARALRALGFDVMEAGDGAAAVELFREHRERVALVLLDMTMPRMDGAQAFRAIREADPAARVVMMSGYSEQDAADRLATEGLAGFLQKPYELATLQATVRRALEGGAA